MHLTKHTHTHTLSLSLSLVSRSKDDNNKDAQNMVILNDIHIDIMDYITPAHCSLLQFRQMWAEFEWENKVCVYPLTPPPRHELKPAETPMP